MSYKIYSIPLGATFTTDLNWETLHASTTSSVQRPTNFKTLSNMGSILRPSIEYFSVAGPSCQTRFK